MGPTGDCRRRESAGGGTEGRSRPLRNGSHRRGATQQEQPTDPARAAFPRQCLSDRSQDSPRARRGTDAAARPAREPGSGRRSSALGLASCLLTRRGGPGSCTGVGMRARGSGVGAGAQNHPPGATEESGRRSAPHGEEETPAALPSVTRPGCRWLGPESARGTRRALVPPGVCRVGGGGKGPGGRLGAEPARPPKDLGRKHGGRGLRRARALQQVS